MTTREFKIFTGADAGALTAGEWSRIETIASTRLASFLCLPNGLPQPVPDDLKMVLANFICASIKTQAGTEAVESKHVRNFTINFKTATTNAFAEIAQNYGDIIEQYSNCEMGFAVERKAHYCCGR